MSDDISPVKLAKTEAGRAALAQRALCTPRERQVLILCDGRRTLHDLVGMMGQAVVPVITGLQRKAYVLEITPTLERLAEFSATGTMGWARSPYSLPEAMAQERSSHSHGRGDGQDRRSGQGKIRPPEAKALDLAEAKRAALSAAQIPASESLSALAPPSTAPSPASLRPAATKRSLAGTKMYMLDVLRTQRSVEAKQLVAHLQDVSEPHALMGEVGVVLGHLYVHCGASYTERVLSHLMDIVPEGLMTALIDQVEDMDWPDLPLLMPQLG